MLMKKHRLFWTGGFDSSFRLAELSRRKVKISSVYIIFQDRQVVTPLEIQAHERILEWLKGRPETQAQIMPTHYVTWRQVVVSKAVREAHAWAQEHFHFRLPKCDLLLASYAEKSRGIEIGLEKYYDKPGRTFIALNEAGGLHFDEEGIGRLKDPNNEHPQLMLLHGNYGYSIANRTEVEMWDQLKKWGYDDLVTLTQTCEHPYNGTPCGCCTNCIVKIKSAMGWYLGEKAVKRYQLMQSMRRQDLILGVQFSKFMMGQLFDESAEAGERKKYFRSLLEMNSAE